MTDHPDIAPVTGWIGDQDYFVFREYDHFAPEPVLDVLHGRVAGVVFRDVVPVEVCAEIAARFWDSPHRLTRGAEAPGYYLGSYTWHKPTAQYLDESEQVNPILDDLLDVEGDPMKVFYAGLSDALAREGAIVRPAAQDGRVASRALLRSWHGGGEFALNPHDDYSQCADPQMADFERRGVLQRSVVALNICLENDLGGRLAYWNIQPDAGSKSRLGLAITGSPYPSASLVGHETKYIEVNTGDIYVFNGAHVHAVEPNADNTRTHTRTTLAAMMGFIDDHTVVTWS
ncbi:hypothetical protein [Frankia gtarii]|uniref:hypothetical protein n=1 Tax=Frankia gtarii TaxID=2950102 RepID=UPI0021BF9F53|nr:hypothetical protein [Frankia gtarii]